MRKLEVVHKEVGGYMSIAQIDNHQLFTDHVGIEVWNNQEKHGGVMSVPMFSHFKVEVVRVFSSAQRRKADKGVRIAHLILKPE